MGCIIITGDVEIDSGFTPDRRFRVRSNTHVLALQGEIMIELRDQIRACLDNCDDPKRYDTVKELCRTLDIVTRDNKRIINEIHEDIVDMQEKLESLNKRIDFNLRYKRL